MTKVDAKNYDVGTNLKVPCASHPLPAERLFAGATDLPVAILVTFRPYMLINYNKMPIDLGSQLLCFAKASHGHTST